jgi:hypothetical protein
MVMSAPCTAPSSEMFTVLPLSSILHKGAVHFIVPFTNSLPFVCILHSGHVNVTLFSMITSPSAIMSAEMFCEVRNVTAESSPLQTSAQDVSKRMRTQTCNLDLFFRHIHFLEREKEEEKTRRERSQQKKEKRGRGRGRGRRKGGKEERKEGKKRRTEGGKEEKKGLVHLVSISTSCHHGLQSAGIRTNPRVHFQLHPVISPDEIRKL